jgi:hypothetical protein
MHVRGGPRFRIALRNLRRFTEPEKTAPPPQTICVLNAQCIGKLNLADVMRHFAVTDILDGMGIAPLGTACLRGTDGVACFHCITVK